MGPPHSLQVLPFKWFLRSWSAMHPSGELHLVLCTQLGGDQSGNQWGTNMKG